MFYYSRQSLTYMLSTVDSVYFSDFIQDMGLAPS